MAGGGPHQRRRGYLYRHSALAFRRQMRARRFRLDHRDAEAVLQHHGAGQVASLARSSEMWKTAART